MRKFVRNFFVSEQKWLFWTVLFVIVFANFYSVKSRVTPEPGVALSIYSSYDAMIRVGGIDTIGFEAAPQYREYLDNEAQQMITGRETCSKMLKDKNKLCQASNVISASDRVQHWKSYLLPSVLAAAAFNSNSIAEIRKFDSTNSAKPAEPSPSLYRNLRANGILFFAILLGIKCAVWFLVWFGSRRMFTRFVVGGVFLSTTIWGILVDFVLRRGAGVYALDRLIAGSPRFDPTTSLSRATPLAVIDVLKAVVAPSPSTSLFGITPRSVVIFIAVMMFTAIIFEKSWRFLVLVPVGLGVHFTTFGILLALITPALVLLLLRGSFRDFRYVVISVVLSVPVAWLQLRDAAPGKAEFAFWPVFAFFLVLTIAVPALVFVKTNRDNRPPQVESQESQTWFRPVGLVAFMFAVLTAYSIWRLGKSYGFSDSSGFWTDGFLREGAGRAAPLVGAIGIFLPAICLGIQHTRLQAWFSRSTFTTNNDRIEMATARPGELATQIAGITIAVCVVCYATRGLFL
jgi:hypothetical protein